MVLLPCLTCKHNRHLRGRGRDGKHITCYGCGKKGHIISKCPDGEKKDRTHNEKREGKQVEKSNAAKGMEEVNKQRPPTGVLYTAMSHNAVADTGGSAEMFYVDSGASDHLIPLQDNLHAYRNFAKPVKISEANGGKINAYGSRTLCVAPSANSPGQEADVQDVYYASEVHVRLVSLGKLECQEWDAHLCDGTTELWDRG